MKRTASVANLALLGVIGWYVSNITGLTTNLMELLVLVFALASPLANILALVARRGLGRGRSVVAVTTSLALLVTMFVYLFAHHRIQDFDMDWLELLMFVCMFMAPVLSIFALTFNRPALASGKAEAVASWPAGRG